METEIKSSAAKFHEVFSRRPYHISNARPEKVQSVDLLEGDWGNSGSVICWNYVHDGKTRATNVIIEAIEDEKKTTFKVIEGDLTAEYKSFKFIIQATPKGEGSVVLVTLEYEKMNEDVPEPKTMLELVINVFKDVEANRPLPGIEPKFIYCVELVNNCVIKALEF